MIGEHEYIDTDRQTDKEMENTGKVRRDCRQGGKRGDGYTRRVSRDDRRLDEDSGRVRDDRKNTRRQTDGQTNLGVYNIYREINI